MLKSAMMAKVDIHIFLVVVLMGSSVFAASNHDDASSCTQVASMNVTSGVVMGPRKFVVTASDCCAYCVEVPACVGAVYDNYFCTVYESILATAMGVDGSVVLFKATPAPPTTSAPTPSPPTPAPTPLGPPSAYALLTTCSTSTECARVLDPSCTTEIVPLNSCALSVSNNKYVSVTKTSNGVERLQFGASGCSGTPESKTLFPPTCQYLINDYVSRMGVVAASVNETRFFDAVGYQCSSALCDTTSGCTTLFGGPTEVCLSLGGGQGRSSGSRAASPSTALASTSSSEIVSYYCFAQQAMVATFRYPRMENCALGLRVVGFALPTQECYYDDAENHFWNSCNAA